MPYYVASFLLNTFGLQPLILWFELFRLQIQAKAPQFVYQYIEGFRYAWSWDIIAFHDRFISFRAADDIIRFQRQQFLQYVGGTICFECPYLHLTKTLPAKLCFTTQRLLCNKTVWPDGTCVHLIVHHVVQFDHVDNTHCCLLVEALTGFTVIEVSVTKFRKTGFLD